jgi:hypothetical protein
MTDILSQTEHTDEFYGISVRIGLQMPETWNFHPVHIFLPENPVPWYIDACTIFQDNRISHVSLENPFESP